MSYCAYCGGVIQEGAGVRFCPQCGKPVAQFAPKPLEDEVVQLLKEGKGIEAIKRYRLATSQGLREAKDAVDALAAKNGLAPSTGISSGGGWVIVLLVSAFIGLMVATAGIAIFPGLGMISERFICDGLTVFSQHYSYKPGQSGVTRTFYCSGEVDVSFRVMFYSFFIYTGLSFVFLTVFRTARWIFRRR